MRGLAAFLAVLLVALGAYVLWERHRLTERLVATTVERNNLRADQDSLRKVATSADSMVGVWERRAFTLTEGLRGSKLVNVELLRVVELQGRRLRAVVDVQLVAADSFDMEGEAVAAADSTEIPFNYGDDVFRLSGRSVFPGRITPDPEPPTRTSVTMSATIDGQAGVSCDDGDSSPHVNFVTSDPRVTVARLRAEVDEDVACTDRLRQAGPFNLLPRWEPGTFVAGGIGIGLGFLVGRASK